MSQISELIKEATENARQHGWAIEWKKETLDTRVLSIGDTLALLHSELSEALEDYRNDDKEHFKEEIADEFIRLFHLCGELNIDIEASIKAKMEKNKTRPKNHGRVNY